jgi:hypothetical protein
MAITKFTRAELLDHQRNMRHETSELTAELIGIQRQQRQLAKRHGEITERLDTLENSQMLIQQELNDRS